MNVNTQNLQSLIQSAAITLASKAAGKSGHSKEWEDGFISGMEYVSRYMIPAVENEERQECDAVADSLEYEHEISLSKLKFFGDMDL